MTFDDGDVVRIALHLFHQLGRHDVVFVGRSPEADAGVVSVFTSRSRLQFKQRITHGSSAGSDIDLVTLNRIQSTERLHGGSVRIEGLDKLDTITLDLTDHDRITSRIKFDRTVGIALVVIHLSRKHIQPNSQRTSLGIFRDHTLKHHHVAQGLTFNDPRSNVVSVFAEIIEAGGAVQQVTLSCRQDVGETITLFRPVVKLGQMLWKRVRPDIDWNRREISDPQVDHHRRCINKRIGHVNLIDGK